MSVKSRTQLPESASVSALNCVDLSSPDIQSSVSLLKQACLDTGFFYVINHGIDNEFMEEVFLQSKRFFSLPMEEKMKVLRNEKYRGYTPVFDSRLDPVNQIHGDYKEGYYIGIEFSEDDPDAQKPFYGPNMWPHADILPAWRETMEKYHQKALYVESALFTRARGRSKKTWIEVIYKYLESKMINDDILTERSTWRKLTHMRRDST